MTRRLPPPGLLLACLIGASLAPGPLAAQGANAPALRRALSALPDSARLRLLAPGVVVDDGRFLGLAADSVRVAQDDAVLWVGLDEIEELALRGSRWKGIGLQSAAVGAVGGALAGFFLGYFHCGNQLEACDEHALRVSLRWGLVWGGVGGVAGAAVGSRVRGWRTVFP